MKVPVSAKASLILKVPVSAKAMSEKRFVIHDSSVEEYVLKIKTHKEKLSERELSAITAGDLDRYLAEFIRSVRRRDGGLNSLEVR